MIGLLYLIIALLTCVPNANKHQAPNELNPADSLLIAEFYKSYIQSEFGNDTAAIQQFIKQEAESLDNCYLIRYKQPINGYDIRMGGLKEKYSYHDEVACYGNMIISKGEKVICDTFLICLPDSVYNRLATHKINELDYIETFDKYYDGIKYPHLGQLRKMPFAFFDIDFDGEKELLLRISDGGQRHRNVYHPISLVWKTPCHWIDVENIIDIDEDFDDMTQFDFKNKVLIFHISAGAWGNEWHYYKIENGKGKLVKKIIENDPYYSPLSDKEEVLRITYHDNYSIVTKIPFDKDGTYSYSID